MTEERAALPFLKNEDLKNVKLETEKVNKLQKDIPTVNITELNDLIYAGTK